MSHDLTIRLFYSYSQKDEVFRDKLEVHLKSLKRQGIIDDWHDRKIDAGKEWSGIIDDRLLRADIILLLISPDFLGSDYCCDIELNKAMQQHESQAATVIPISLRKCDYTDQPFMKLQGLPRGFKPIAQWADQDEAFTDIVQGIRAVAENIRSLNGNTNMSSMQGETAFKKGMAYYEKNDFSNALALFKIAASKNYSNAMNNIGFLYLNAHGVPQNLTTAFEWFYQAATKHNPDGLYNVGFCYQNGYGVQKNNEKAFEFYLKAAHVGHDNAKNKVKKISLDIGMLYENGDGVERNNVIAFDWYKKSAEHDNTDAQYRLGKMCVEGRGTRKDNDEAFYWFEKASQGGHAQSSYELGKIFYEKNNYIQAVDCFIKAAKENLSEAQNYLGLMYLHGQGMDKDYSQAFEYFCLAMKQGYAQAYVNLGSMYWDGFGVEENQREARRLFETAAQMGDSQGKNWLGIMYQWGLGVEHDENRAFRYYFYAAESGNAAGQCNLGVCYQYGKGVEQDEREAVKWYQKSADQGNALAQYYLAIMHEKGKGGLNVNWLVAYDLYGKAACYFESQEKLAPHLLAYMYEQGKGVPQDYCKAATWYQKAVTQGHGLQNKLEFTQKKCFEMKLNSSRN